MFRRDLKQFRFEHEIPRFMGERPPEPQGYPDPPPFGGPPGFGPIPPFAGPHPKPPLPMGREAFQEIRDYMLLLIILEYEDGITGYQLQDIYKFPRGTLIRTLQDLENKEYLCTREEIIEGRANKFYMLTEKGKKYIEELKMKWANIFSMMAEINPPKVIKTLLFEKIEDFETKEDAIDFFRGIRSWMKGMLKRIEESVEEFRKSHSNVNDLIKTIEEMNSLDKEKIKDFVKVKIKDMETN